MGARLVWVGLEHDSLGTLWLGMGIAFHVAGPFKEAPKIGSLAPHEFPEFQEADLLHLDAGVRLDTPKKIRAVPWSKAMPLGSVPKKADLVAHASMITRKYRNVHERARVGRTGSFGRRHAEICPSSTEANEEIAGCWAEHLSRPATRFQHDRIQTLPGRFPACLTPMPARRPKTTTTPRSI